jgi:broad specificity phosphatase PhoE
MARLFLIRHGRPAASWGQPEGDPGLSDLGREQARAAAALLAEAGPLKAVSSPMRRCLETAEPFLTLTRGALAVEPRVSEIKAPAGIEDRAQWLQQRFPWRSSHPTRTWDSLEPGLRTWRDEVIAAACAFREDAAVFSHFIAINVITGAAMGSDRTIVCRPDHASITQIEVAGGVLKLVSAAREMQIDDVR